MSEFLPHKVIHDLGGAQENFAAIDGYVVQTSDLGSRGATNIATSESRSNTAYGTLTTPDQVTGIVLPAKGLIAVWYQATWQSSVGSAGKAAIFLGVNQLKGGGATPTVEEAGSTGVANNDLLATYGYGLNSGGFTPYTGDVTTGQIVGIGTSPGPCYIFAAAGTYTVSVQFKASSGSVTASNRKLWVQVLPFG